MESTHPRVDRMVRIASRRSRVMLASHSDGGRYGAAACTCIPRTVLPPPSDEVEQRAGRWCCTAAGHTLSRTGHHSHATRDAARATKQRRQRARGAGVGLWRHPVMGSRAFLRSCARFWTFAAASRAPRPHPVRGSCGTRASGACISERVRKPMVGAEAAIRRCRNRTTRWAIAARVGRSHGRLELCTSTSDQPASGVTITARSAGPKAPPLEPTASGKVGEHPRMGSRASL